MKKVVALVLSLLMIVSCVFAFAEEAEEQAVEAVDTAVDTETIDSAWIIGDWYAETHGAIINIRLNEDGTAQCFIDGAEVVTKLIWTIEGSLVTVTSEDGLDPLSGVYDKEADVLPLSSEDGMQVLFTRENPREEASVVEAELEVADDAEPEDESEVVGGSEAAEEHEKTDVPEVFEKKPAPVEDSKKDEKTEASEEPAAEPTGLTDTLKNVLEETTEESSVDVLSAAAEGLVKGTEAALKAAQDAVNEDGAADEVESGDVEAEEVDETVAEKDQINAEERKAADDQDSEEPVEASEDTEDLPAEDATEEFFHDPEGWVLDPEMTLTSDLMDIFEFTMMGETRFQIRPVLHLGTKVESDRVQHCYLCVLNTLADPDNEALFLIYINEPFEGEPYFHAGLELMLTLSPYEEMADAE